MKIVKEKDRKYKTKTRKIKSRKECERARYWGTRHAKEGGGGERDKQAKKQTWSQKKNQQDVIFYTSNHVFIIVWIAGLSPQGIKLNGVTCCASHFCCTLRASNPAAGNKEHSSARELVRSSFKYSCRPARATDRCALLAHCDIWSSPATVSDVVHLPSAPKLHFC
jgi:hypothetical protein